MALYVERDATYVAPLIPRAIEFVRTRRLNQLGTKRLCNIGPRSGKLASLLQDTAFPDQLGL